MTASVLYFSAACAPDGSILVPCVYGSKPVSSFEMLALQSLSRGKCLQAWAACGILTSQEVHNETAAVLVVSRDAPRPPLHSGSEPIGLASPASCPTRLLLAIQIIGALGKSNRQWFRHDASLGSAFMHEHQTCHGFGIYVIKGS